MLNIKSREKSDSHENYFSTRDSVKIENGQLTAIGPSSVKLHQVVFLRFPPWLHYSVTKPDACEEVSGIRLDLVWLGYSFWATGSGTPEEINASLTVCKSSLHNFFH